MQHKLAIGIVLGCAALAAAPAAQAPGTGLRGFSAESAAAQRKREAHFRSIPSTENLREYMRTISKEPHHAGSPGSRRVAEYVLGKLKEWGLNAAIEEYEALMPYPTQRVVELFGPEPYTARLSEPAIASDEDSADEGGMPTFNAYSADGDVTAELVYVNYGTPEDYEELEKLGISVKGRIVIARYGRSWRGIKPKVAWEHGAVGCIIYSDPRDDGYFPGDVYPDGPFRPEFGVQRGSVMDMPLHPGDPLTPGRGARAGERKLDREQAATILKIPVLPISYGDALPLLRQLEGPVAPESWRGALPITYHIGPGPARVRLALKFDWQVRPLYNVVARIEGSEFPDQWVIYGNHHDAWVNGASDPTSGNVVLMETARGLSELLKTGWRPRRTIVIASWDGEEWGLLGSTEWAEHHKDELLQTAVAYINTDSTGTGWLSMGGSHSLQSFINQVARDVDDPRGSGTSVLEAKRRRELERADNEAARERLRGADIPIEALGSGSDYTAFIDHLAVASLNLGFGGESSGGVYHSAYDTFAWYTAHSDGDFKHSAALARVVGTALLRLADADVLPFEFRGTAWTLRAYVDELEELAADTHQGIDLSALRSALDGLQLAAARLDLAVSRLSAVGLDSGKRERLADLNRVLYSTERAFRYEPGLPRREWFKHLAYAPGFYTGYGVKTLPAIREGLEQRQPEEARRFVPVVAEAIKRLAGEVDKATEIARELAR